MAKLDGLSAFHPSALIAESFILPNSLPESKKDSKIVKSFILAFRYYKDDNHSSDFLIPPPKPFKTSTFFISAVRA